MPASPVYELDIPAPHDAFFVHGEKALSVAPTIDGAAPRTNYHLAIWTWLEGGEYQLRLMADNTSSWSTSVSRLNYRVFLYTKRSQGPSVHTIHMPRGLQRIDLLVSNLLTVAGPCWIAFSLHRQGKLVYSSNAVGWVFNNSQQGILDSDIPGYNTDIRMFYPIFTLLPNWRGGILERLGYSTEILTSESQAEQRRSLRVVARRSFEASFLRSAQNRTRLDSFLAGVGKHEMLVPMWHEQFVLTTALSDVVVFPTGTLRLREFRAGMFVLVQGKDPAVYERLYITAADLETDTITLQAAPEGDWPAGSRLLPLRAARVRETTGLENKTDRVGSATIRFNIEPTEDLWYSPLSIAAPVFRFTPNRGVDVSVGYERSTAFEIDHEYGPVDVYDADQRETLTVRGELQFRGREDLLYFRRFLDMVRGRSRRFWCPSFTADFEVLEINDDQIDVKAVGLVEFFRSTQEVRAALVIEFHPWSVATTIYSEITDAEQVDEHTERITVAEAIGSIDLTEVRRVSYLAVMRFDQDTVEIHHLVDQSAVTRTSFVLRSTNRAGLPLPGGILAAFTSLVYPMEQVEAIDVAADFDKGTSFGLQEKLDVSADLDGGTLAVVIAYKTLTVDDPTDSIDVGGADLISGTLTSTIAYKTLTADPEGINATGADLLSGTLNVTIQYPTLTDPSDDEKIDVAANLVGGTLETV